ncbi:PFL_4695 family integrating conjugative element protein [Thioalkalivibrio sp. ALE20]|uniref:PFL_4695 family integrating conjugative element protein n=1 Tax=Thioalkalivibrio sp. ALE20 TaxID=545275 RepID=UPI00037C17E3|nr:integrating conjugative element protein [Thioalkalivibrio sp. ALE20]
MIRNTLTLIVLLSSAPAMALDVLHDTGEGQSADPWLERLEGATPEHPEPERDGPPTDIDELERMLPVETPELSLGVLEGDFSHAHDRLQHLPRPLCLVGSDDTSLQWLEKNRDALMSAGTVCMLVEAETRDDLERVREVSRGLPIELSPASSIAERLGLEVYPVVISGEGVEQ